MTGRPADPLAVLRDSIVEALAHDFGEDDADVIEARQALAALERLVEAARRAATLLPDTYQAKGILDSALAPFKEEM